MVTVDSPYVVNLPAKNLIKHGESIRQWLKTNIGEYSCEWLLDLPDNRSIIHVIFNTNENMVQFILVWGDNSVIRS